MKPFGLKKRTIFTLVAASFFLVFSSWGLAGEIKITDTQTYYTGYYTTFNFQTGNNFFEEANGTLHLAYVENYELKYVKSTDGGQTWSKENLAAEHNGDVRSATLTVDHNGKVFIGFTCNDHYNYANPTGVSYGLEFYEDLYCIHNKAGTWTKETIYDPTRSGYSDNYGPRAMAMLVDADNHVHLFANRAGWYTYGGTAWEWIRDSGIDTWGSRITVADPSGNLDRFIYDYYRPLIHSSGVITMILSRYNSNGGTDDYLFYTQKTGSTWSAITAIDQPNRAYASAYHFDAANDQSNNIYLVYIKDAAGAAVPEINFSMNWGAKTVIYTAGTGERIYDLKLHSDAAGNLTLFFRHGVTDGVYPTKIMTRPAGGSWSTPTNLATSAPDSDVFYLSLAHSDGSSGSFNSPKLAYFDREVTGQTSPGPYGPDIFYYYVDVVPPDTDPPTVISVNPADGAVDVGISDIIKADFSEIMDPTTLTASSFTVSDGAVDIPGTIAYSDTTAFFNPTGAGLNFDGTTYTATITTEAKDLAGLGLESDYVWSFTTTDNNPPLAPTAECPTDEWTFDTSDPVNLTASPFDDPEDDNHVMTHWEIFREDSREIAKSHSSSVDLETYTLPDNYLAAGLKYTWRVGYEDVYGEVGWSEEHTFKVGTSQQDDTVVVDAGTDNRTYKMASFVQYPDDPRAEAVFGDDLTQEYLENYRIGIYDAITGAYIEYGEGLVIEPGKAYWFLARNGLNPTIDGIPVSLVANIHVKLAYNANTANGWNMVGCPNGADYLWGSVEVAVYDGHNMTIIDSIDNLADNNPYIDKRLWCWEDGTYFADNTIMEAYEGYWARAKQADIYLVFKPAAQLVSVNTLEMMVAKTIQGLNSLTRKIDLPPKNAIAADQDSPPMPMGALGANDTGGSGGGCFIDSLTN